MTSARFLTEDSYLGDITEPLTLNRYNYCMSSWLNYQDPSGNAVQIVGGLIIGAVAGLVSGVVSEVVAKYELGEDYNSEEWGLRILNSTISGAAGGAVFSVTGSITLASTAAGGTSGFIDGVTHWEKEQGILPNLASVVQNTSNGLARGAVSGVTFEYLYGVGMATGAGRLGSILVAGGMSSAVGGITGRLQTGMANMHDIREIGSLTAAFDWEMIQRDIRLGEINALIAYGTLSAYQKASNAWGSLRTKTNTAQRMEVTRLCEENESTSLANEMSPEEAVRYQKFLAEGSQAGLTPEEQLGISKVDEQLAQSRVNYDEVLQGRNGASKGDIGSNIIEFPSNPEDFNPEGLTRIGPFKTKNGEIIKWIDENKKLFMNGMRI